MPTRKKILFVGEASFLATGYATYYKNVLSRLFATGKYEIAEFAAYTHLADPRLAQLPWRVYSNLPLPNDEKGVNEHNANPMNQFGAWRFEEVLLDFRPSCVVDHRDIWMFTFEGSSPFRPYYHWTIMPPVDSAPQDEQWIDMFMGANAVSTYTEFGTKTLAKQSAGEMALIGETAPGADLDVYFPVNSKEQHKKKMGFGPDVMIVGTVMRNQKRKLYPDLFQAFELFLQKCGDSPLAKKTYLYLHTSYPDSGWDIPRLLKESTIGHKVLFSYLCRACNKLFPAFFQDAKTFCPHCGKREAMMPNTQQGATLQQLADVYNLFDAYVQYAICEGFGMPAVEAAACGVPVFAVDYSGMEFVNKCVKGFPIRVERFFRESETHAYRAMPDNADFVEKLYKFLTLPTPLRIKRGREARAGVEKHLTWERTAKVWENHFDSIQVLPQACTWQSPPRVNKPQTNVPGGMTPSEMVNWGIVNVLGEPDKLNTYFALRLLRDLNAGMQNEGFGGIYIDDASFLGGRPRHRNFGPQEMFQQLLEMAEKRNRWEARRVGLIREPLPDYIVHAKPEVAVA